MNKSGKYCDKRNSFMYFGLYCIVLCNVNMYLKIYKIFITTKLIDVFIKMTSLKTSEYKLIKKSQI